MHEVGHYRHNSFMAKNETARILLGRRTPDGIRVIGEGVVVEPQFVLVELALSGPLRPLADVVLLPRGVRGPVVPVLRVHRGEDTAGTLLGLEPAEPLTGPLAELPQSGDLAGWLARVLRWDLEVEPQPGPDGVSPDDGPSSESPRRGGRGICRWFPRAPGCR